MSHYNDDLEKWISVRAKSGKKGMKYHTFRDCLHLQSAANVRKPSQSELDFFEPEECSNCKKRREEHGIYSEDEKE
jgi:hypothetical protein